tara:strand:- start:34 stop:1335 length:1302 start_codon:yes stop_codon:yes gene_type:complete
MAYAQHFGLSRNSPLSKSYSDKLKDGDIEPSESDKKWGYTGPDGQVTGTEYSDPKSEYNTVGAGKGRGAWDPKGGSDEKGGYSEAVFTDKELSDAKERVDLKTKIDQVKGGETWKNSKYNKNPKLGFNEDGQATYNSRGDKMFLGDEDVTKEYYEKHNKAGGKNQTFSNQLDYVQDGLGVLGFTPGYGAFADGANSLLSGFRGVGSLLGAKSDDGTTTGGHFKNMLKHGMYAVPVAGDLAAAAKIKKYTKYLPTTKKITDYTKGLNLTNKTYGKTKKGQFAQNILGASKNWESKGKNLFRGSLGFATGKNYNKFGQGIETVLGKNKFADVVKMGTSSKAVWGKPQAALNTIGDVGNALTETTSKGLDSIKNAFGGQNYANFDTGGFLDNKNKNKGVAAKAGTLVSTNKKVDTNPSKANSIIDQNNNKSNAEVI